MSNPVVVGTVGKQSSVLKFAIRQARDGQSPLWVVHSTGVPPQAAEFYTGREVLEDLRQAGQTVLDDARQIIEDQAPDLDVEYILTSEAPIHALKRATENAHLLVLGTDDVPWYERLLRTRVAGHMARHASCPVVVVPEQVFPEIYEGDIVLTLDGDTSADGVIRFAFEEANARDAVLHVLHASPPGTLAADADEIRANLAEMVSGWHEVFPDVMVLTGVAVGDPTETLTRATESASLVIIGRPHGHTTSFAVARPLALDVLRRAHCPVAVVPATYPGI